MVKAMSLLQSSSISGFKCRNDVISFVSVISPDVETEVRQYERPL